MATSPEATDPPAAAEVEPEGLYEVVDGRVVGKPPKGAYEADIANLLAEALMVFVKRGGLGRVILEALFRIAPARKRDRRPDVAFISAERWPVGRRAPKTAAWDVVPDLAVEVLSPGNRTVEDADKVDDYFRAGVRAVWQVYPTLGKVYVYDAPTSIRVLTRADRLDGGSVLPGFSMGLAELFGPEEG